MSVYKIFIQLFLCVICFYFGYELSEKPMLTRIYHYKNNKMIKQETFVNDALRYGCEAK